MNRKITLIFRFFYGIQYKNSGQESGTTPGEFLLLEWNGVEFSGYDFGVDWRLDNTYIGWMV